MPESYAYILHFQICSFIMTAELPSSPEEQTSSLSLKFSSEDQATLEVISSQPSHKVLPSIQPKTIFPAKLLFLSFLQ